jgi:hypothetical protein
MKKRGVHFLITADVVSDANGHYQAAGFLPMLSSGSVRFPRTRIESRVPLASSDCVQPPPPGGNDQLFWVRVTKSGSA